MKIGIAKACVREDPHGWPGDPFRKLYSLPRMRKRDLRVTHERVRATVVSAREADHEKVVVVAGSLNCLLIPLHALGHAARHEKEGRPLVCQHRVGVVTEQIDSEGWILRELVHR